MTQHFVYPRFNPPVLKLKMVHREFIPDHVRFKPGNNFWNTDVTSNPDENTRMTVEPKSLQEMCINKLCFNHKDKHYTTRVLSTKANPTFLCHLFNGYELTLGKYRLSVLLSEELLSAFSKYHLLTDETIQIFNSRHTNLTSAVVKNATLTMDGLQIFQQHSLVDMTVSNIGATFEDIAHSLGLNPVSDRYLKRLSVTSCSLGNPEMQCFTMKVFAERFQNLVSLSLVSIKLDNTGLEGLCSMLTEKIFHLDISGNPITDISSLCYLAGSLKSLVMYDLYSLKATNCNVLMYELKELVYLDVSCRTGQQLDAFLNQQDVSPLPIEHMLVTPGALPKLRFIDLSGREDVSATILWDFLEVHPDMEFIGLVLTPATHVEDEEGPEPWCSDSVKISSLATGELIGDSLTRYKDRNFFVQKALVALFELTKDPAHRQPNAIPLILEAMADHREHVSVQMAATASLFNLTRDESGPYIHPESLKFMVHHVLESMARHPHNQQVQKNCLLTLCTDRMLVEVNFDKYRCANLAMECLCKFHDSGMERMILAIVSILAAKITTEETSVIASNRMYMRRLIEITKAKLRTRSTDCVMKFVLSALWNLTDESPAACRRFAEMDGIMLARDCLSGYENITDAEAKLQIQTKVVGLLNNIAEVKDLRMFLITPEFIDLMRKTLVSKSSEHSYFSGGILANLLCDGYNQGWLYMSQFYDDAESDMISAISNWRQPEAAMVAYRCFRPFVPLLAEHTSIAAKYWAIWAINHVCVKDPKKYVPMIMKDGIYTDLFKLTQKTDICQDVLDLARDLYDFVHWYKMKSRNHSQSSFTEDALY